MPPIRQLYCDHATTSFPKPPEVLRKIAAYGAEVPASAGPPAYAEIHMPEILATCRNHLNDLFHGQGPQHFLFTASCTDALNLAIQTFFGQSGGHVITTSIEHNSVLQPLHALRAHGRIDITQLPVDPITCLVDPTAVRQALRPDTKLIVIHHASHVTGTLQPIRQLGKIARAAAVPFLVDAAQTAGHFPIDLQTDLIDLLAFPGHKGLMGPRGTGGLYVRPGIARPASMTNPLDPAIRNENEIAALSEAVAWVLRRGVPTLWEHERALMGTFLEGMDGVEGLTYFGPQGMRDRIGIFSVRVAHTYPTKLAERLALEFGIATFAGLHDAPAAHLHLGTASAGGTLRVSFGPFLTAGDVAYVADALAAVALEKRE